MSEPGYQEFGPERMPVEAREGGVQVKVVAGQTSRGAAGPVAGGAVDARYLDVTAPAGARFAEPMPSDLSAMVVVYEGAVRIGGQRMDAIGCAFLGEAGDELVVESEVDARFLVIAGRPIGEPVAWAGPFVMNTREEVMQAYDDFRRGRF